MEIKKKILFIVQLPPPVHGASLMNMNLLKSNLLLESFEPDLVKLDFVKEVKQIGKFSFFKIYSMIRILFDINKKMILNSPDIVYFTLSPVGFAFLRDAIFMIFLKIYRRKIVIHLHGKGIKENVKNNFFLKYIYKFVFNGTEVICLSDSLRDDIVDVYKKQPYVVNNGIKTEVSIFEKQVTTERIQLLFLSNISIEKGILDFLESLKHLTSKNYYVNIIGSAFDIKDFELKKYIEQNNLQDNVKFLGPKFDREKEEYLQFDTILVFPTYYKNEAFPLVILEAMKYGIPVISTNEGAIGSIIEDGKTGYIVNKKSPKDIAKKIDFLLKNPNTRNEFGFNAKQIFKKKYAFEIFENNMVKLFNTILK